MRLAPLLLGSQPDAIARKAFIFVASTMSEATRQLLRDEIVPGYLSHNEYKIFKCATCTAGRKGASALMCGRCCGVVYCDKACQREHWAKHKLVCKRFVPAPAAAGADAAPEVAAGI